MSTDFLLPDPEDTTLGTIASTLAKLGACSPAIKWLEQQPSYKHAWASCEHGAWMLWLAGRTAAPASIERRRLALALVAIIRAEFPALARGSTRHLELISAWGQKQIAPAQLRAATRLPPNFLCRASRPEDAIHWAAWAALAITPDFAAQCAYSCTLALSTPHSVRADIQRAVAYRTRDLLPLPRLS
jgi:hypothetical protein